MISHDLSVLAELCDRITVMYAGRVVEEGPADRDLHRAAAPLRRGALGGVPRVGDPAARFAPAGLPGDPPDPRNLTQGCSFAPRCAKAADECLPAEPPLTSYGEGAGLPRREDRRMSRTVAVHESPKAELAARGVKVDFTTRSGRVARALDGADLLVRSGEVVALVGESGSGKTTLARTLVGLTQPSAGEVVWEGRALDRSARGLKALRRQVQLVLQDPLGRAEPAADRLRVGGRGAADPQAGRPVRDAPRPSWSRRPWRRRACGRRSSCSCATPTSCPAASGSGS